MIKATFSRVRRLGLPGAIVVAALALPAASASAHTGLERRDRKARR